MPVEFLSDEQAAAYGRLPEVLSRSELERYFFLDDVDRGLVETKRRDHNKLGFALQLLTVRNAGAFLDDPLEVPVELVDYLAEQLGIAEASCVKYYGEREKTRVEHVWEIRRVEGWREFAEVGDELGEWIEARAWTTGDGPKALFDAAVAWLREHRVLLPGVTTLVRLVAARREAANRRLWETLHEALDDDQRATLDDLLEVPEGHRTSRLDRLRRPPVRVSGPAMVDALHRAAEILGLGFAEVDTEVVPPRRLAELSRYGVQGKASLLRRHGDSRRLATLLATVVYLQTRAVDDALDLLDVLIGSKLLARAERESNKEKLRTLPKLGKASVKLAAALGVLLEVTSSHDVLAEQAAEDGAAVEPVSLAQVWAEIENVVPRTELTEALSAVVELAGPPDSDADEAWRAELVKRFATVRPFLPLLCEVIRFDAAPDGQRVLAALRDLPRLWGGGRNKVARAEIDEQLLVGSWRRLVLHTPGLEPGCVDWRAYTFCVLEQFHRCLRRRDIFAVNSSKWGDPRAKLLAGSAWNAAKPVVLSSLGLPPDPDEHLDEHAELLDATFREVTARLPDNTAVRFDEHGRLHLAALPAEAEPSSLENLRVLTNRMLPRVDLPEVLLEVFSWTGADQAFTSITGGEARLADLHITIAALLVAEACNIGWTPVIKHGAAALTRDRLAHVDATYLRMDTIKAANAALIEHQADIGLARLWGGGHVASVDGMRFVVPVATISSGPNPRYFGQRRYGATWLNMVNDQAAGLAGKVVAGTPRDSLHVLDVLYDRDGGAKPQMIVTDTASYSDIVFGLLTLAGYTYAPQLADLPDQKLWCIDTRADYGPFTTAARGRIDLDRIRRHWDDILRVIASIHTGAVRAHDVIRMLSRDGHPTPLGEAIAHYGRIHKTLHVLRLVDDTGYRRDIKAQANLQEGRHALARRIFHGQRGELRQRYYEGMEDQLGALGLVLNAIVLFNTRYLDAALTELRSGGYEVRDDDAARLSPFVRHHVNMLGRYSFLAPELAGLRPLRDPSEPDEDEAA